MVFNDRLCAQGCGQRNVVITTLLHLFSWFLWLAPHTMTNSGFQDGILTTPSYVNVWSVCGLCYGRCSDLLGKYFGIDQFSIFFLGTLWVLVTWPIVAPSPSWILYCLGVKSVLIGPPFSNSVGPFFSASLSRDNAHLIIHQMAIGSLSNDLSTLPTSYRDLPPAVTKHSHPVYSNTTTHIHIITLTLSSPHSNMAFTAKRSGADNTDATTLQFGEGTPQGLSHAWLSHF